MRELDLSRWPRWRPSPTTLRRRRPPDRHPDQQRRRHDPARAAGDRRRLRAAVRHQPPRPLRPHRSVCCRCCAPPRARDHPASVAAHSGGVTGTTCNGSSSYDANKAYSSSKIAVGLFGLQLERLSRRAAGASPATWPTPGVRHQPARVPPRDGPRGDTLSVRIIRRVATTRMPLTQTAAEGILPPSTPPQRAGRSLLRPERPRSSPAPPPSASRTSHSPTSPDAERCGACPSSSPGCSGPPLRNALAGHPRPHLRGTPHGRT